MNWPIRARRRLVRTDGFIVVFVVLLAAYVVSAVTAATWGLAWTAVMYVVALLVAVEVSSPSRHQRRIVLGLLAFCTVELLATSVFASAEAVRGSADVMFMVLLVYTLVIVLTRVLHHPTVTIRTIAGALSAYLLIGLTFTSVFGIVAWASNEPFFASGASEGIPNLQYFSFTTLTTLGYGDLTAASGAGRALATLEALFGQVFLATLLAGLVSAFRNDRSAGARRPRPHGLD